MSVIKSDKPREWISRCNECAQQVGPMPTKARAGRTDALHRLQHHTVGGVYYQDKAL